MLKKLVLLSLASLVVPVPTSAFEICLWDGIEKLHLNVLPKGLLTGYSEYGEKIVGTAIGSYKRISASEVMMGGSIHNDCNSGMIPGSFSATINIQTLQGTANGNLLPCNTGQIIPIIFAVSPCENQEGKKRQNWGRIEDYQ